MQVTLQDVQNVLNLLVDINPLPNLGVFDTMETRIERGLEFKAFVSKQLRSQLALMAPEDKPVDDVLPLRAGLFATHTSQGEYTQAMTAAIETLRQLSADSKANHKPNAAEHYDTLRGYYTATLDQFINIGIFNEGN